MGVQAELNSLAALRLTPDLHLSSLQTFISIPNASSQLPVVTWGIQTAPCCYSSRFELSAVTCSSAAQVLPRVPDVPLACKPQVAVLFLLTSARGPTKKT
jgi:hypothetical protein